MQYRGSLLFAFCLALLLKLPSSDAQQPTAKPPAPRTDIYGDLLPEGAVARLGLERFHHGGGLSLAAFSADSKAIVAVGFDMGRMSLRVWDSATGKKLSQFAISGTDVTQVAFAHDGKSIFVGFDRFVEQYDRQSGKLIRTYSNPNPPLGTRGFAISADGRMLGQSSVDNETGTVILLWEIKTGKQRDILRGHRGAVVKVQFSVDGKRCMAASSGNRIKGVPVEESIWVWDIGSGKLLHEIKGQGFVNGLAPNGLAGAFTGEHGETHIVDFTTGQTTCTIKAVNSILEFSPDSKSVIAVDFRSNNSPYLWDAVTGVQIKQFNSQHRENQRLIGFSPNGKLLAAMTGGWEVDGSVAVWSVATGELIRQAGGHVDTVTSIAFSPNGKLLASGSRDATVLLWDWRDGKEVGRFEGHNAGITCVAFSADGNRLASSSKDGDTRVWDVAKHSELAKLEGPQDGAASLMFISDGKRLIAGGKSHSMSVWDLASFKETHVTKTGNDGSVFAISVDGKLALSANGETRDDLSTEKLRIWKLPDGQQTGFIDLRKTERMFDNVATWTASLSADGRIFAASHSRASESLRGTLYADHTLRVWERATGQVLHTMSGSKVHSLTFSPNGRLLAAGHGNNTSFGNRSFDSKITIWDILTGEPSKVCQGHANEITCVAFSPDGKFVASGSADHTILIWSNFQPSPLKRHAKEPTAKQQQLWWDELTNAQSNARDAMADLVTYPDQTVKWMAERLKPVPAADVKQFAKLIDALDSKSFKEREKAQAALDAFGELAELHLRRALAGMPTLEQRRRVEMLLAKIENVASAPEQLRSIRAIAALEWIGTAEAKELLGTLAKGTPEARLTQLAQAALDRLRQ